MQSYFEWQRRKFRLGGFKYPSRDDGVIRHRSQYSNQDHRRRCDIFRRTDKEMVIPLEVKKVCGSCSG